MKKSFSIGTWITVGNFEFSEIIFKSQFDWICIDLEHSTIDLDSFKELVSLGEKYNKKTYARIPEINKSYINKILDAGANGLIIANVSSKSDIDKCIDYAFYSPKGSRGVGLSRAQVYGNNFEDYFKSSSKKIDIIPIIESKEAVDNLEEIIDNEVIKTTMIGPYDLSSSIGTPGRFNSKEFKLMIEKYKKISINYNKEMGLHVVEPSRKLLNEKINENFKFLAFSTDTIIFDRAIKSMFEE